MQTPDSTVGSLFLGNISSTNKRARPSVAVTEVYVCIGGGAQGMHAKTDRDEQVKEWITYESASRRENAQKSGGYCCVRGQIV